MASFLQRLALPFLSAVAPLRATFEIPFLPGLDRAAGGARRIPRSKHTVAQDRRAAAKRRALKRAKRLGQA